VTINTEITTSEAATKVTNPKENSKKAVSNLLITEIDKKLQGNYSSERFQRARLYLERLNY
jgi:hypothetical protein